MIYELITSTGTDLTPVVLSSVVVESGTSIKFSVVGVLQRSVSSADFSSLVYCTSTADRYSSPVISPGLTSASVLIVRTGDFVCGVPPEFMGFEV